MPTASDLLTQAGMLVQQAVAMLAESTNQAAAVAQAMAQIQAMVGQGTPQPMTLDAATAGLHQDMQAGAATGSY